jgi:pyruvate-ferredoxin/flavodoxin oxidoreductase
MGNSQIEMKRAVDCGYWQLYRYNPALAAEGKNPFKLDSKEPAGGYPEFLEGENRYAQLKKISVQADELFATNEAEAMARYAKYKKLSE